MRQDMNVEDEYYKAIEDRDTTILQHEKELKKKDEQLHQRDEQIKNIAKSLYQQGMPKKTIAAMMNLHIEEVITLLSN